MKPNPKLYGADTLECELFAAGWRRSPNNINALASIHWMSDDPLRGESPIWYPGHDGQADTPEGTETQVCSDRIRVFRYQHFGEHYSKRSFGDTVTVAVFDNTRDFLAYCAESGRVARSLPAYAWGD